MGSLVDYDIFERWDSDSILVVTVSTLATYNAFELLLMILSRLKERRSLLFVSLVVATTGVFPYLIGLISEYFQLFSFWVCMLLSTVGWICLISGQAVVLYSRLGLILQDHRILKAVKWMIIVDAFVFHTSTTIVQYGKSYGSNQKQFNHAFLYIEKIQMTGFCLQEFIISGLYLWKTTALLRVLRKKGARRVMVELFTINVVIVLGDIALVVLEYLGETLTERTWKGLVYSIKLKLEFAILSKLVDLVQAPQNSLADAMAEVDTFVDASRTRTNTTATLSLPLTTTSPTARKSDDDDLPDWLLALENPVAHVENIGHSTGSALSA